MHSIPVTDLFAHFVHNFQVSVGLQCLQHDQHLQVLWYVCCSHILWFCKVYRLFTNHLVKLGTETMSTLLYLLTNHPANPSILGQVNTKRPRLKQRTEDFLNSIPPFLFLSLSLSCLSVYHSLALSLTHTNAQTRTLKNLLCSVLLHALLYYNLNLELAREHPLLVVPRLGGDDGGECDGSTLRQVKCPTVRQHPSCACPLKGKNHFILKNSWKLVRLLKRVFQK